MSMTLTTASTETDKNANMVFDFTVPLIPASEDLLLPLSQISHFTHMLDCSGHKLVEFYRNCQATC